MRALHLVTFISTIVQHCRGEQDILKESGQKASLVQPIYTPFSLGTIKPSGWLKGELKLEANGLAGNMFDFYRFVHDAKWIGGNTEYSILDEASPYWFNGLVPLAFGLGDDRITSQVKYYLDYVLDHQQDDGWLGFETTRQSRGIWARCLLLYGLVQYADADSSQTERILDSMHRYVKLAHSMLMNNYTGLIVHGNDTFDPSGFGVGRTHEMHLSLQWLYENYPRENAQVIWETMELMIKGGEVWGADWRTFWTEEAYPKVYSDDTYNMSWVFVHGVNMAEGLRYPLAIYRMTHDEALKKQTRTALDLLFKYHKGTHGSILGDEYITDLSPTRGSELCIASEMIFSLGNIYQYLGDNDIADWAEQVAFNAQPASVAPDWWSHQYVQQENQPWSRNLTEGDDLWYDVGSYSNVFGLEPNYPCCTVNHPQAYPKFLANSFLRTDDGIAHTYLVSGNIETKIGDSNVNIKVETDYPFSFDIAYTITASASFPFYVRIPKWANNSSSIIKPGESNKRLLNPAASGLQKVSISAGENTTFHISLETQPRVVHLAGNTVAIYYGALLYSLAIEYTVEETTPLRYNDWAVLNKSTTDSHTHDHTLEPTSPWAVAIDPSQIKVATNSKGGKLESPIWDLGAPPIELRVAAVEIDWPLAYDSPADPPQDPKAKGKPFSARFVPYGSAKLHMVHLPSVQLPKVDLSA